MENKFDCIIIASEFSGAKDVFDLLNQNFKSTIAPEFLENNAFLILKSGIDSQKRLGVIELKNLQGLRELDFSTLLKEQGQIYLLLRNPIERAYAAYQQNKEDGKENSSFIEAIKWDNTPAEVGFGSSNTSYILAGKYSTAIKNLVENSREHRFQLIQYETLINSSFQKIMEIKENLELEFKYPPEEIAYNLNKHKVAGRRLGILSFFSNSNRELEEDTAKYIYYTYFKRDIEELESLLGVNLSSWKFKGKTRQGVKI